MRQIHKYVLLLILLNILLTGTVLFFKSFFGINMVLKDFIVLLLSFSAISAITLTIFLRGLNREPDSQTIHTLAAVSLKFLFDILLALVWFLISKKTSLTSVFVFFVIYLTLTLFTIFVILKILKNRSLQNLNHFENKGSY
jgi:hypothetical protein